jgi:hypothetical protein
MADEDAVLLTDAVPTGYFGAQLGGIVEGDTVIVFGAGPVGLVPARSAWLMGAGRVIVIDHLGYRLEKARSFAHAETYKFTEYDDIVVEMKKATDHLGADVAVGAEADGNLPGLGADLDPKDRPSVPMLRFQKDLTGAHWEFPERQPEKWPRERSIEHNFLPPSSAPPARPTASPVFSGSTPIGGTAKPEPRTGCS